MGGYDQGAEEQGAVESQVPLDRCASPACPRPPTAHTPTATLWPACGGADIFCLDQNDPKKMETIRRSDQIYAWANEYHVMGFGTFKRGWCLMELGVTTARLILYSYPDGLRDDAQTQKVIPILWREHKGERRAGLQQLFGFEAAGFSVESDRDIVRGFIQSVRGDVASFEAFLVEKVLSAYDEISHLFPDEIYFPEDLRGGQRFNRYYFP